MLGELFLALDENLGGVEENFGALRTGGQVPAVVGSPGGINCGGNVLGTRGWKISDQLVRIGGITIFEGLAAASRNPLTIDEVIERLRSVGGGDGSGSFFEIFGARFHHDFRGD